MHVSVLKHTKDGKVFEIDQAITFERVFSVLFERYKTIFK